MKIFVLYLHALKVKLYFAFMLFVLEAIGKFEVIGQMFGRYVEQFRAAFNQLNRIYLKYDQTFYTEEVQKADDERDIAFRKMRDAIRSVSLFPPTEEKAEAAEILLKIISLYGGGRIPNQGMNEETTSIVNLIEDLEDKYAQKVEILGIGQLLAGLKAAQQKFTEVYMARTEYDSEIGKGAMAEARKKMDEAYRDFITIVNLEAKNDSEGKLTDFINLMNTEIGKYRTYTKQGQVNGDNADSEENVTDTPVVPPTETTPTKYTIEFEHNGQVVSSMELEAGATITPPAAPSGYHWVNVPTTMPAENITITSEEDSNGGFQPPILS